ncbi:aldo-keto reductase family 1 member B1-like isoform X2 [Ptychodera flava]|uniref:aldo-keto reductase family 1 member B1-like isoform X2 n=1 Tax=Ptychodera flava TaxID=63121 RepID=UPI003969D564
MESTIPLLTMNNGLKMPQLGLGTYMLEPVTTSLKTAIDLGYRHFDTAWSYGNEKALGDVFQELFKEGKVKREDIFIVTKSFGVDGEGNPDLSFSDEDYTDTWKEMERLVDEGTVKSIGVSNFNHKQVERILQIARKTEKDPVCPLEHTMVKLLADKYQRTPAQILLRLSLDRGCAVIPKSQTPARMKENLEALDFQMTPDDIKVLEELDCNWKIAEFVWEKLQGHPHYPFNEEF